jgi:RHS repeat-associated protein
MLWPAGSEQTVIDLSVTDGMALRVRVVVPWRLVVTAALLSLLLGLVLAQGLAGSRPFVRAGVRSEARSHKGLSSLPLTAQGPISAALGADDAAFRVSASGGGFRAVNPAQRLGVRFGRSGVFLSSGTARLGLNLLAVGYGASLTAVGDVTPHLRANRVVYARAGLSEWYVNGPLGLEQGFTIPRALGSHVAGPLTLSLALSGDVHASLSAGGQSVMLSHSGEPSLRYDGLMASEARGRGLHSWLQLSHGRILLRVDTRGARYPLRIDPLVQQGPKLTGSEEVGGGEFGYSVALSSEGNTALIGGPVDNEHIGAAWVFTRSGTTWTQQGSKLTGGEETGTAIFGTSVALSAEGNTALIGGSGDNSEVGAAWVFTLSEGKWTQQGSKLTGGEETGKGDFGTNAALSSNGNTALIGGLGDNTNAGAAWVFTRSEGKWTQQGSKLTGGGETGEGWFGKSVALSAEGNTALIGAPRDDNGTGKLNEYVGAAFVFTRSEGKWTQQGSKFSGSEEVHIKDHAESGFGRSVALSSNGNTALIGGAGDDDNAGAAWVFTRSEGKWTQQGKKLTAVSGEIEDEADNGLFGWSVALSSNGNIALIGGPGNDGNVGAAWEFVRSGTKWGQEGLVITGVKESRREFGGSVALSAAGTIGMIGGPQYNNSLDEREGAAWAFAIGFSSEEMYGPENEAEPDQNRPCVGDPVNCATGNEVQTQTDLTVGGRGPGLNLTRTYNSQLAAIQSEAGPFGYGWTGPYSAHLTTEKSCNELACEETALVYQSNGSAVQFTDAGGTYFRPAWVLATLTKEGSTYIYTLPDQSKLDFNSSGQLTSETDHNGNAITLSYNSKNQLETATDGAGRKLTFTYNSEGFVESVKDPMGHTVKYTYESGNLMSVTQPAETSLRWQFKYNAEHELTSETDGRGHAITTEYNSSHQVTAQTDAMERKRTWKYGFAESGEAQTTITEPTGAVTVEQFNSAMLPTVITHAYGTSYAAKTLYEYNENNELIAVTDPDEHTTTYGYNATGDKTSAKDANSNETKWTYNSRHEVETMTTPKGETTTYKRNSDGDPETIERPAPGSKVQKTTYKYDSKGDLTSETNPLEHTRTFEYDTYGDRESETDAEGNKRTWKYNEDSQEVATVSPRGNAKGAEPSKYETKTERSAKGQPLKITDPLGHTTKYTYDGDGNVETMIDGNEHKTTYTYNADNERTKVEEPNKAVTETEYDADGNVTAQTDGNKHTTKYERNKLEEVTEVVNPLGKKTTMEYDAAGNLKVVTDPEKRTTTYTYDPGNRLKEVVYSSGKPATIKYEYDKDGDRTKMTDGTGTNKYTYDVLDRLTETENGNKEKVKYEYDLANDQTKITYPNTKAVTRAFDKDDRLEKVTDWNKNETTFKYSADSQLEKTVFPSATKDEDKYAYNNADQMSEIDMNKSTEALASLIYTRDNDGQVKKTVSKGLPGEETTEDAYDENNRLTKAGSTEYKYDAANNPTTEGSSTNTFNEGDELEKGTGVSYTYNELGERTKRTPTSGPATTYGYDQAGNLTSVERPKEGETAEIKDTYAYNGDGLRASQTISGTTTYMAWDVAEPTPLLLSDGTNSYIYGPGNLPIEQINNSTGTVEYMHHDQAGSTRLLTGSTGTVTGKCTYGAYGTPTCEGTATTPLGYDAQYTSTDTGLIYLRARVYDPQTAEFLSVDPLSSLTGAPYYYASDNPLNASDPTGLVVLLNAGNPSSLPGFCETTAEKIARAEKLERLRYILKLDTELMADERERARVAEDEPNPLEDLAIKDIKAVGGCIAGSDVGALTGLTIGGALGNAPGALAGAVIGAPAGCAVGGLSTALAPVPPLEPSEGGP